MLAAINQAAEDDAVQVVVVTGAGRSFPPAAMPSMLATMKTSFDARYIFDRSALLLKTVYNFPKPVIAAVNGAVAGAATGCTLACDIVIASEKAKFAANFVNIAFSPMAVHLISFSTNWDITVLPKYCTPVKYLLPRNACKPEYLTE